MTKRRLGPLRQVVSVETYRTGAHPRGTFSCEITLACGHKKYQKGSRRMPKRAHCPVCSYEELQ